MFYSKVDEIIGEFKENKKCLEELSNEVQEALQGLFKEENIKVLLVDRRIKNEDSLREKILSKHKYESLLEITDIIGFRIITYFNKDIDRIKDIICKRTDLFEIDNKNSIDKRNKKNLKQFDYSSYHLILKPKVNYINKITTSIAGKLRVEIQIRTILQHAWAEVEHDLGYKSDVEIPLDHKRRFYALAGVLELADNELQALYENLAQYKKEIKYITELNKITIFELIRNSEELKKINLSLCMQNDEKFLIEVSETERLGVGLEIDKLKFCGFKNTEEIKEYISNNVSEIIKYSKEFMDIYISKGGLEGYLHQTAGLLFIVYYKLFQNYKNEINIIKEYSKMFHDNDKEIVNNILLIKV